MLCDATGAAYFLPRSSRSRQFFWLVWRAQLFVDSYDSAEGETVGCQNLEEVTRVGCRQSTIRVAFQILSTWYVQRPAHSLSPLRLLFLCRWLAASVLQHIYTNGDICLSLLSSRDWKPNLTVM